MSKKIVTFFLCIAIVFSSLCNTAMAARPSGEELITDTASVNAWNTWLESNMYVLPDAVVGNYTFWNEFDHAIQASGAGACDRRDSLISARDNWNGSFSVIDSILFRLFSLLYTGSSVRPIVEIAYDSVLGVDRLREVHTKLWIVNSSGHFPYFKPISGDGSGFTEGIGQWILKENIKSNSALWHTVIGADLSAYMETWPDKNCVIEDCGDYFWIAWTDTSTRLSKRYVLCDEYGYPYYVPKPKQTAVTTPNNYYTEQGDTLNVYDQGTAILDSILDVEHGILNVGGEAYYVDEINYDDSTKTYYVDSHDSYTWNTTTNNYITNNYKWEITYNIDYTSVTYIGQTAEYEEEYKYYYELPDGRSSADLTREDLEQLSVVFYDVMNYSRTTDNDKMRALYHFDGNTEDSSYWSYTRHGFKWLKGASLTYMDEGVFNGSLYLDETEHQFEITLPGTSDAASDWSLQFRYYQSYTEVPVKDSYLSVGGTPLLYFTGSQYLDNKGAVICATSVGTWNEICLVRSGGSLLYFINGVYYKTSSCDFNWSTIGFYFGNSQQTYKKIDELRFTKKALYNTSGYTPSVVPYDTNLALVLPDAATAIADEYVIYTPPTDNIHLSSKTGKNFNVYDWHWNGSHTMASEFLPAVTNGKLKLYREADYTTYSRSDDGTLIMYPTISSPTVSASIQSSNDSIVLGNGFFLPVVAGTSKSASSCTARCFTNPGYAWHQLSVILSDGSYSTFGYRYDSLSSYNDLTYNNSRVAIKFGYLGGNMHDGAEYYIHGFFIYPIDGEPVEIVDLVLTGGLGHKWEVTTESVLYDADDLTEDPILAVRSNRPIINYQIGGVRPSYPEKGQVYALVENNRITSLQQYTGALWEAVDGRIWTGSRWIPYSSFDVKTLQDFWDVEGTSGDDYIYSESGFWSWFQKQWKVFMGKLDQIIYYLSESVGLPIEPDCEHVYTGVETPPTCSTPGGIVYTCKECGHEVLESVPALGHDWIVIEDVPSEFELPEDAHCPSCAGEDFTYELNSSQDEFTCTCSVCDREWKETPDTTWGHTISKCSRCGITQIESKAPNANGLFTAIGNFLSDGIDWILDKLTQAVDSISGIQDTFQDFAARMKENVGAYPAFLAAAVAVVPGDLMDVIWFAVVALVAVLVYKKVTR